MKAQSNMGNRGNPKRGSRWGGRAEIKNDFRRQRSNRHRRIIQEELKNHKMCRVCQAKTIGKGKKCSECALQANIRSFERRTGDYYPYDL